MDEVPLDVLALFFSYFDVISCLRYRAVCRNWRRLSGAGCGYVRVKHGALRINHNIGSVTLVGRNEQHFDEKTADEVQSDARNVKLVKRTRGHLPDPNVLGKEKGQKATFVTFLSALAKGKDKKHQILRWDKDHDHGPQTCLDGVAPLSDAFAIRIERNGQTNFQSLDIEASTYEEARRSGFLIDTIIETSKPRLLKKSVIEFDISGLRHLHQLSVRGCGCLEILRLPPCLTALDASGCLNLREIGMPAGASDRGLVALNLNGNRSLQIRHAWMRQIPSSSSKSQELFGASTEQALKHTQELDMSSVNHLPKIVLANALRATMCLVTVSLRYVTTDAVLAALAKSTSAREALRFVDVAFSSELTDTSIEALVQSAPKLERCNLRGCKHVSAKYYNEVPILLEKRRNGVDTDVSISEQTGNERKRRKGDNIFFFVAKTNPLKSANR